jgi:hypothetical protein
VNAGHKEEALERLRVLVTTANGSRTAPTQDERSYAG